jgi:glycosyltransferase involved in cell wall biosynthesis
LPLKEIGWSSLKDEPVQPDLSQTLGVVVIGRNEGERLIRCLHSLQSVANTIVYVDSGSTDGSPFAALGLGARVVQLSPTSPFTAARARNEGFARLSAEVPDLRYVFFVDGDCEVSDGWLETALAFLEEHPGIGAVWGIRRERYPAASIFNQLCDIEWSSEPEGETTVAGGDLVVVVSAFRSVTGYRTELICGEEPEMCIRLRRAGWRVWHLHIPMTVHDAAILHFSQWWTRMVRSGYAYAQGLFLHGASLERHGVRESMRIWWWGVILPALIVTCTPMFGGRALLLFLIYPLQFLRLAMLRNRHAHVRWWWAGAMVVGKFAEAWGQIRFLKNRVVGTNSPIIEYK